jgi:peptidoglycan hydrolase CwlO-like protein
MKKLLLLIAFSLSSIIIFAQELKDPTFRTPFTESSGNFMVLTVFDKIGKSDITIDYIKKMQQEITDSQKQISEQQKQMNDSTKTISEQRKQLNEQKREIDDLKNIIRQLKNDIDDLKRKVK